MSSGKNSGNRAKTAAKTTWTFRQNEKLIVLYGNRRGKFRAMGETHRERDRGTDKNTYPLTVTLMEKVTEQYNNTTS